MIAARSFGRPSVRVPVTAVEDLTPEEIRAIRLRENEAPEHGVMLRGAIPW